jgi:Mor family transcriptional regulator
VTTYEGDWLDELTPQDFPKAFQDLVQLIGVRATVALAQNFGGLQFYIPKADVLIQKKRDELIRKDRAAGFGYRDLALKYKLTEIWIRQICDHQDDTRQMDMFAANS